MQTLPKRTLVYKALAVCLIAGCALGTTAAEPAAAPAKPAAPAATKPVAAKPAAAKPAAAKPTETPEAKQLKADIVREKITREEGVLESQSHRDKARELAAQGQYEQAINAYSKAIDILEKRSSNVASPYTQEVLALKKERNDTYALWAEDLYRQAEELYRSAPDTTEPLTNLNKAIEKCRKAQEVYPQAKEQMDEAIQRCEKMKNNIEFYGKVKLEEIEPGQADKHNEIEIQLQRGKALYRIGRFDEARALFDQVIAQDPYNTVAIDYLRRIYLKMIEAGKKRKDLTASELIDEVAWKPIRPVSLTNIQDGQDEVSVTPVEKVDPSRKLRSKLDNIKFKSLIFEDTPLIEVIKYLKDRSKAEDKSVEAGETPGVNFVLRLEGPVTSADGNREEEEGDEESEGSGDDNMPLISIYIGDEEGSSESEEGEEGEDTEKKKDSAAEGGSEISLGKVIEAICENAGLNYRVEEYAVVIAKKDVPLDDFVTEFYTVEKEQISAVANDSTEEDQLKEYFQNNGIDFPENARITYDEQTNKLIVTNTPENQDKVREKIKELNTNDPQIEIQVKFAEVSMNDLEELGFQYVVGRPTVPRSETVVASEPPKAGADWERYAYRDAYTGKDLNPSVDYSKNPAVKPTWYQKKDITVSTIDPNIADQYGDSDWHEMLADTHSLKHNATTFLPNDKMVRDVMTDPLVFGVDAAVGERRDDVFNWNYYTKNGFNINAQIHALDQADSTDTLCSPRVTTLNGQSANIKMVTKKYYPTSWGDAELDDVNGLSVFIPSIPEFSDPVEEGIVLEVEPSIADEEKYTLSMVMNPVILNFIGWTDYSYTVTLGQDNEPHKNTLKMPIIGARSVSTTVACYDKSTIILGGVLKDKVNSVDDQYPILGDIPLIGRLFQSRGHGTQKTNLLIFLTGTLVNSDGTCYRNDGTERGLPQF